MYAVVGCGECRAVWVVDGEPEATGCPRCGKRHQFGKLKRFAETADPDEARQARAALLADREGYGDAFAELDSFAAMDADADEDAIDDATYLEAAGLDSEVVADAGERTERGTEGGSRSKRKTVTDALDALDRPTEAKVVAYATERGVPAEYAERALGKLRRNGDVAETNGRYRLL